MLSKRAVLKLQPEILLKRNSDANARVFFWELGQKIFFTGHFWASASDLQTAALEDTEKFRQRFQEY